MKKLLGIFALASTIALQAQNVVFSKVVTTKENTDKNLYSTSQHLANAEYLAEVEVLGFTTDDALVFKQVYSKAKEVGANTLEWQPFISIDDKPQKLDPHHYKLALYYSDSKNLEAEQSNVYIFGSSTKDVKITINDKKITLPARSYIVYPLNTNDLVDVRVGGFLGSRIKVNGSQVKDNFYFQLSGNKVTGAEANINLKGGDILGVDPSFGEFLKIIYKRQALVK